MAKEKVKLSREQYRLLKSMDHKQADKFLTNLYNEAYESGLVMGTGKAPKPDDIRKVLNSFQSISEAVKDKIMQGIIRLYEGSGSE